jgi:SAM-dependent methyltransferase
LLSRNDPKHLRTAASMHDIFHRVLEEYRPFGDESLSGPGSTLARTVEIRRSLPLLVEDMGIRTMLDAPCGDFHWMRHVVLALDQYTGVDIVPGIIEHNQGLYGEPNRNFRCLDLTRDPLPEADMIFCRDCLPHFSFEDIFGTLRSFSHSKSKYLLTTSFVDCQANEDIATGDWRPLNFQRAPFHFPQPLRIIHEQSDEAGGRYRDKSLLLWKLQEIL